MANPGLSEDRRAALVKALMDARRAVGQAKRTNDTSAETAARRDVQSVKVALGERGPVWWTDGSPDLNRRMVRNTDYAGWYDALHVDPTTDDR